MPCSTEYSPRLRLLGFRVTSQRLAILHVLRHARGHLAPNEVHARARKDLPGLTPTTVYRTLEFLRLTGLVWRTHQPSGHLAYELAKDQHHHLICRRCGTEVPLSESQIAQAYSSLETISGFTIDHEHLSLTGLCPKCIRGL